MYFDSITYWIFNNVKLVLFLVILYFILRAVYASVLALRASSCNTVWLEGTTINAETLFERIKTNMSKRGIGDVAFSYANIQDSYVSANAHRYLKIKYKSFCAYISAFPMGQDGIISYWVIAPRKPWEGVISLLPFYGKVIINILRTPTLYMADIQSATLTIVEEEIQAAIDDVVKEVPRKKEIKQEFKTFIEAATNKKK